MAPKGEWGQDDHCLPKAIQIMREDVVPFVTSGAFFSFVLLLIGGYGLYRDDTDHNYWSKVVIGYVLRLRHDQRKLQGKPCGMIPGIGWFGCSVILSFPIRIGHIAYAISHNIR